ncbi:MAG: hypothetical protein KatS3mg113_0243 [Planctomycetaceae bacterium]|nr:MAG: hypothetical protein KatS3mg113_0243 [Planctomycetaceae bacterium]
MSANLVEQIVQGVLQRLQQAQRLPTGSGVAAHHDNIQPRPTPPTASSDSRPDISARAESNRENAPSMSAIKSAEEDASGTEHQLDYPVITADLLQLEIRSGGTRRLWIGPRSILTPAARDWLQQRKIVWSRRPQVPRSERRAERWVLFHRAAPIVQALRESVLREGAAWRFELLGTLSELVETGQRLLHTAETPTVLIMTTQPAQVACRMNRSPRIRAAVVYPGISLTALWQDVQPHALTLDPTAWNFAALRQLLKHCAQWTYSVNQMESEHASR